MKNTLTDLNNYLFEQIERLNDDELKGDKLQEQLLKSKAIGDIASQIISSGELTLKTHKFAKEYGIKTKDNISLLLQKEEQ